MKLLLSILLALLPSTAFALVGSGVVTVENGTASVNCSADQTTVANTCKTLPDCDSTGGALYYDQTTHAFSCATGVMNSGGGDYGHFTCTAGTCTIDNGVVDLTTKVTGALPAANGGTGQSSYAAKGDMLVSSGTTTLSKLSVGSNNYTLVADSAQSTGVKWDKRYPVTFVQSDVTINITTAGTKYISLTGNTCASEADCVSPIAEGTYTNLACTTSADQSGKTVTVAWGDGTCNSTISYSSRPSVTITSTANTMSTVSTSNPATISSGDTYCSVLKVTVTGGTMAAGYVKCRFDKTS